MDQRGYDEIPQRPIDRLQPLRDDPTRRWKTFDKFPSSAPVSARELYEDGFFYIGDGLNDRVQCAFCGGIFKHFHQGDNIHEEHKRIFKKCPYVNNNNGNKVNLNVSDSKHLFSNNVGTKTAEVTTVDPPRHPLYSTKSSRLNSYTKWPKDMKQKPEELAEAGLFYTGEEDKTICYQCGGALVEWEPEDTPAPEHDTWFPDCQLAKQRKREQ